MKRRFVLKIDDEFVLTIMIIYYTSKLLWDRLIPSVLSLLFIGVTFLYVLKYLFSPLKKKNLNLIAFSLVFCIYIIMNAIFKDDSAQFLRAIYEYILYAFPLLGFLYIYPRVDMLNVAKKISVYGLIIACLSWYEYFSRRFIIPIHNGGGILYGGSHAFRSAVFSRSALSHGIVLGFFSLLLFYVYANERSKRNLIFALFAFASILTTSSRGPLVAATAGMLISYFMHLRVNERGSIKQYLGIVFLVLVLLGIVFVMNSSFVTGNETIDYFLLRTRTITDWSDDAGNVGRISRWNWSIQLYKKNKLWGIGPSKTGSWGAASIGVTESGVLRRLCELGLVGFGFHYMLIITTIICSIKKMKNLSKDLQNTVILFLGTLVMVLINDITVQSTEEPTVCFIMWFAVAGLIATTQFRTKYYRGYL